MNLLDQLNPRQREAALAVEGPVLILAGAGSGKTRVITYRIVHLIEDLGAQPDSILAVTFTNKAAAEMAERVSHLLGGRTLAKPLISTFHSFCVRVLRRDIEALNIVKGEGYRKDFAIYDDTDQQSIVKAVMRRLGIDDKQIKPSVVLGRISWAKNHMKDPQEIYLQSADRLSEVVAQVFTEYRKELRKANALDFDDLLLETVRLLKSSAEVRERYQRRFEYLLIDEYQDTNRPQYELIKLLAGGRHNVCVVGDEDQSIYSWRGADIRNILEFEQDFPEARVIRLEQNYRSTQTILEAASAVVAHNTQRKGKTLWTDRQGGAMVGYYEAPDGENEALFAADTISRYMRQAAEEGKDDPRVAVLYRTNSQSRLIEEAMRRYQLKYQVVGGFSFYERAEIKDMISYLKLINNLDDSIALQRVINTPTRGIGKTTLETIERLALETGVSTWAAVGEAIERKLLPPRALTALAGFRDLIDDARAMLFGKFIERLGGEADRDIGESGHRDIGRASEAEHTGDLVGENISFDFGANDSQHSLFAERSGAPDAESGTGAETGVPTAPAADAAKSAEAATGNTMEFTADGLVATVDDKSLTRIKKKFEKLAKKAHSLKINPPQLAVEALDVVPVRHRITFSFQPPQIGEWTLIAVLHHEGGRTEVHPMEGVEVPEQYHHAAPDCDHCRTKQRRKDTFILENEARELKQVGRTCLKDFFGGLNPEALIYFSDAIVSLKENIAELKSEEPAIIAPEADAFEDALAEDFPPDDEAAEPETPAAFRTPGGAASVPEVLKFLLDRTGYIKQLEQENTPDSLARTDNLRELVNAAMDARDRGETLAEFLDHAALVSDVDTYDPRGQVTLMTLHSAKGLEFNLVLLVGLEEGLFPHSRTFNDPAQMEEERRLCYVGMTRAMDQLILTRADFRRRYGTESPEASTPSRFLEEVPGHLLENIGTPRSSRGSYRAQSDDFGDSHYNYEDEDQSVRPGQGARAGKPKTGGHGGPKYNSIDNIADFFASRGKKFNLPKALKEEPSGKGGFKPGQRVRHPKYGEGVVYQREGEGESAKITVQFPRFGIKKLVEKYAQLEKA